MNYRLYRILLLLTIAGSLAGLLTLVPRSDASWPNIIGYKSLCTFAPAGTLYCFTIAGSICLIRANLVKKKHAGEGKRKGAIPGFMAVAAVLALALVFTVRFMEVKSEYTDTGTGATELPGGATDSVTAASETPASGAPSEAAADTADE